MCSHGERKKDHPSPVYSYKGTNTIHEGATLMIIYLSKALPPNTITLRIKASTYEVVGSGMAQTFSP